MKSKIIFCLKVAFAVVLIYVVVKSGALKLESLKDLCTPSTVAIGLVLVGINSWLLNWRWYWLLRARGFNVGLIETFRLYLIGLFFNYALPSSVGGDVVKAYYLARDQRDRRLDAALSVLIDRVLGLYSMILLALLSGLYDLRFVLEHKEIKVMMSLTSLLFLAMSASFVVGFSKRVAEFFRVPQILNLHPKLQFADKIFKAMQLFGEKKSVIFGSVFVSVIAQLITIAFFVFIGTALGVKNVPLAAYVFCVPLGLVATALPVAPAGVGVGQFAFLYLFQAYAPGSGEMGATAITAFQLTLLICALPGAYFYIRQKAPAHGLA
jgi:glycosyltransferase 2 family protein